MKRIILFTLILLMGFIILPAREYKGVTMADTIKIAGKTLILNGMALRKKVIIKVYIAGLYLEQKDSDGERVLKSDSIKRMVMHFVRKVGLKKINNAWREGLKANTPNATPELKKQFEELCSYMEDEKKGDKLIFTFIPSKGTEIRINEKVKGSIVGKEFARALFSCWIGEKPGPGKNFKAGLLGK